MNSAVSACKLTALAFIFLAVLASQTGKEKRACLHWLSTAFF
jgi:hypothetical protein